MPVSACTHAGRCCRHTCVCRWCTAAPYRYIGCYGDGNPRRLPVLMYASATSNSVDLCYQAAAKAGYRYFGVQFGAECYAGDDLGAAVVLGEASCAMPCVSNAAQVCGNAGANSVYEATSGGHAWSPSALCPHSVLILSFGVYDS